MHINKLFFVTISNNFEDFGWVGVVGVETEMCTVLRIGFEGGMHFLGCLPSRKDRRLEGQLELDMRLVFHICRSVFHECQQAFQIRPQEPDEDPQIVP